MNSVVCLVETFYYHTVNINQSHWEVIGVRTDKRITRESQKRDFRTYALTNILSAVTENYTCLSVS